MQKKRAFFDSFEVFLQIHGVEMKDRMKITYERLGFVIVETIQDSRHIMKRDNRNYDAADEERKKTAHHERIGGPFHFERLQTSVSSSRKSMTLMLRMPPSSYQRLRMS